MKYLRKLDIKLVKGKYKNPVRGQVRGPKQLYKVFKAIKDKNQETLIGVYLTNDLEVSAYDTLSIGSTSGLAISSDEVFNRAIITRSRYIVLIHNHPSGNPNPSPADMETIAALQEGAKWLRKTVLDFIIVGDKRYWSMFEDAGGGEYELDGVSAR
jgi:DNA repair protein RadC